MVGDKEEYDLCMLEHIIYMRCDGDIRSMKRKGNEAYKNLEDCKNVGEYVDQFDISDLRETNPSNSTIGGDEISRAEYAAIIEYLQDPEKSKNVRSLSLNKAMNMNGESVDIDEMKEEKYKDSKVLAYDLVNTDSNQHVVIFKGTEGGKEWKDNVEGLNTADTKAQIDAYEFVESINSKNITVVGHSKGGNKAMYCAIRSDKVEKCVSMDGQGFSDKFIEKYKYRIANRAIKIKNISYSSDFVHALMIQIPGSIQVYTGSRYGSNGVNSVLECHSPNSLFTYTIDDNGNLCVTGTFDECEETRSMSLIRGFTEYIIYSDCEDKEEMIAYIADIIGNVGENKEIFINSLTSGESKVDGDKLANFIAHFLKYCDEKGVSDSDIVQLLVDVHLIPENKLNKESIADILMLVNIIRKVLKSGDITFVGAIDISILKMNNKLMTKLTNILKDWLNESDINISKEGLKSILESLSVTLLNVKKKYDDIDYDDSKKTVIFNKRLKEVNNGEDAVASHSPEMCYNLQEIQAALSKMEKAKRYKMQTIVISQSVLSGKSFDSFFNLCNVYNTLYEEIYDLIESTQKQVQAIYDALNTLENS